MVMNCLRPTLLTAGDELAIVAVSKRIDFQTIEPAVGVLEGWGLKVKLAENLKADSHQTFAGTDNERLDGIQAIINDPHIKAIICSRGGYGATRIIDKIDFRPLQQYPKWIIGFSDITVLLCQSLNHNVESIHAPMAFQFNKPEYRNSVEFLKQLLFEEKYTITSNPNPLDVFGSTKAPVIGGNLTMLTNMLGTATEFDPSGKILLLEDIEEYVYKMDRMMVHLKRAGKLKNIAGAIIGHMTDMLDNEIPFGKTVNEVILEHFEGLNIPVCFGFPSGHEPDNLAIPFGRTAEFEVSAKGTFLRF
jgi:muramoyltetrapeptide carboxypeptidase